MVFISSKFFMMINFKQITKGACGTDKIFDILFLCKKVLTKLNFGAILRKSKDEIFEKGGKRK